MSGERAAILARVREALRVPAPHHHHPRIAPENAQRGATVPFREWLPPVGSSESDRITIFARLSEMLRTEFVQCSSVAVAAEHIARLANENEWRKVATHKDKLCEAATAGLPSSIELLRITSDYEKDALESCNAGVTGCESLIAQTGSVCVTTKSSGGRALSVLPPHHVVVARRKQLLPDLTAAYDALAKKYAASGYPSFIGFITGPSRTGDIERILVLGAHGPKKLTVLLVP